ncbi:MAG: (Fe-S)-binding protein [Puniceicoccales bacterium]|nr:(Fe-S)-binding protein [Puniceicoccales bacterium]
MKKLPKNATVALFVPCYIDTFYPQVGVATLEILEKLGLGACVFYPDGQTCCGQPMANSGAERSGEDTHRRFVEIFKEFDYIVTPSASCAGHVRHHYDRIEQTAATRRVRANIYELCEFLTDVLDVDIAGDLGSRFPHKVGLHQSCHGLRALGLGTPSELVETPAYAAAHNRVRRLLEATAGIELVELDRVDECCGFGGTFAVFEPDISAKMGADRVADHERHGAEFITGTDTSCLMHLEGILRRQQKPLQVRHIAEILNSNG